ncbi:MAG TPA: hypothetical protein VK923_04185 [Euzebyales bacterium]|nr:hypothetical protein [Euzebyales bacterium]
MTTLWTAHEAAQADYEQLRAATLDGVPLAGVAARRFAHRGLAGLIAWPAAEPVFAAELVGAARPAWMPHADPRVAALAGAYELLLTAADTDHVESRRAR